MSSNTLWIAIFVIVLAYLLARWLRARRSSPSQEQTEQVRYLIRSSDVSAGDHLGAHQGLSIKRYYFRNTEADAGPADPLDFYDELFIDLEDPDTPQKWQNSIHVATPRGLDRMMAEEQWDSVIGGELLIVRRYELETILNAAVEHLQEIYEVQVKMLGHGVAPPPES
jgi:hypothetical protein